MGKEPLVAMVVPAHNNKQDTREFLESLKGLTYPNFRTIIIDDGSTDGTGEMIRQEYPEVIMLAGDGNLWWSGCINKGIGEAIEIEAKYVLIVDNDTVVHPEFISALVSTAEKNPKSIVSPKVYYYHDPKMIQSAGWKADRWKVNYARIGNGEIDHGQYDTGIDIDCATMGTFVNTDVFKDIGVMDFENMRQYGADQDFALRARKRGYRILYEPRSVLWHKEKGTVKREVPPVTSFLSALIYLTKNPRSQLNCRMRVVYTLRHVPLYLVPLVLARYLLDLIRASLGRKVI